MKKMKPFFAILAILFFVPSAWVFAAPEPASNPASVKPAAVEKPKAGDPKAGKKQAKANKKAEKKKPEGFVIGKNLKAGMNLDKAVTLLGVPLKINVKRGTEPSLDSISIEYARHGVVIHAINGKQKVEAIELLPVFKGQFENGTKIGDNVSALIEKYGVPKTMDASLARYPDKGLYFSLKENSLVSARIFVKNSKILSHQLFKN